MAGNGDSMRAILFALGANFAIAVAKGVAAFFSGSSAMLAETVHSLADCGNQGLLLLGMRQAQTPPSPDYPLGYGKAIYFWSFLVAVMLFSVGGMFSLYEGIHKLSHPEPLRQWWWAAGVLVFSIIAESVSMRACLRRGEQGARRPRLRAMVPREPPGGAGGDLRRGSRRPARPGLRARRDPDRGGHRQSDLGRRRHDHDRRAADRRRRVHRDRSQGDADRPERGPGNGRSEMRSYLEARPEIERVFNLITLQLGNDMMVSVKARMASSVASRPRTWSPPSTSSSPRCRPAFPAGALEFLRAGHG